MELSYCILYTAVRSSTLVRSDFFLYVSNTLVFTLGGTDSRVIRTIPSHHIVRMAERLVYLANKMHPSISRQVFCSYYSGLVGYSYNKTNEMH